MKSIFAGLLSLVVIFAAVESNAQAGTIPTEKEISEARVKTEETLKRGAKTAPKKDTKVKPDTSPSSKVAPPAGHDGSGANSNHGTPNADTSKPKGH